MFNMMKSSSMDAAHNGVILIKCKQTNYTTSNSLIHSLERIAYRHRHRLSSGQVLSNTTIVYFWTFLVHSPIMSSNNVKWFSSPSNRRINRKLFIIIEGSLDRRSDEVCFFSLRQRAGKKYERKTKWNVFGRTLMSILCHREIAIDAPPGLYLVWRSQSIRHRIIWHFPYSKTTRNEKRHCIFFGPIIIIHIEKRKFVHWIVNFGRSSLFSEQKMPNK